jgi:membrane protein DedA with SNARE-associated domain
MPDIIPLLQTYPYESMFVIILIEEAGVWLPISGDNIVLFVGVLSKQGGIAFLPLLLSILAASLIGATFLYYISRWLGDYLLSHYQRQLQAVHITQERIARVELMLKKHSFLTIALVRLVPGLRIIGTIAAGGLHIPYPTFISATLLATVVWTAGYYYLGALLGRKFASEANLIISRPWLTIILAVLIGGVWFVIFKYVAPAAQKLWRRMSNG